MDRNCILTAVVDAQLGDFRLAIGRRSAAIVSRDEIGEAARRGRAPETARWARQVTQMSGGALLGLAVLSASAMV